MVAKFEYTPDWYGDEVQQWITKIKSAEQLAAHFNKEKIQRNKPRFETWFEDIELSGSLLELGFNAGKSITWLAERFPALNHIDGFDWNPSVQRLIPFIKENVPAVNKLWRAQCDVISAPDNFYDNVSSLDFFEHLTTGHFVSCLQECRRVLKSNGTMVVYIGESEANPEHINCMKIEVAIAAIESQGFKMIKIVKPHPEFPNRHNMMVYMNEK